MLRKIAHYGHHQSAAIRYTNQVYGVDIKRTAQVFNIGSIFNGIIGVKVYTLAISALRHFLFCIQSLMLSSGRFFR